MAFQVVYTTVFADNAPLYDEWVALQDASLISQFSAITGNLTPAEVMAESIHYIHDIAEGFVDSTITNSDNTNTLTEIWESQAAYESRLTMNKAVLAGNITLTANSAVVSGVGTAFTTDLSVLDNIVKTEVDANNAVSGVTIGAVASIESDTQLTLTDAWPNADITDTGFTVSQSIFMVTGFIYSEYANAYIVSNSITTSTV